MTVIIEESVSASHQIRWNDFRGEHAVAVVIYLLSLLILRPSLSKGLQGFWETS